MNDKIKKFAELCADSRHKGLTTSGYKKKRELLTDLIEEGVMYNDNGINRFTHISDSILFSGIITESDNLANAAEEDE